MADPLPPSPTATQASFLEMSAQRLEVAQLCKRLETITDEEAREAINTYLTPDESANLTRRATLLSNNLIGMRELPGERLLFCIDVITSTPLSPLAKTVMWNDVIKRCGDDRGLDDTTYAACTKVFELFSDMQSAPQIRALYECAEQVTSTVQHAFANVDSAAAQLARQHAEGIAKQCYREIDHLGGTEILQDTFFAFVGTPALEERATYFFAQLNACEMLEDMMPGLITRGYKEGRLSELLPLFYSASDYVGVHLLTLANNVLPYGTPSPVPTGPELKKVISCLPHIPNNETKTRLIRDHITPHLFASFIDTEFEDARELYIATRELEDADLLNALANKFMQSELGTALIFSLSTDVA